MISNDHGCAEIAPKGARCRHPLVWRKGRLFQPVEPNGLDNGAGPSFSDFRGGWVCPECEDSGVWVFGNSGFQDE
jgi:rubredoxin